MTPNQEPQQRLAARERSPGWCLERVRERLKEAEGLSGTSLGKKQKTSIHFGVEYNIVNETLRGEGRGIKARLCESEASKS